MVSTSLHVSALDAIPPTTLYKILWLRVSVFVVEQGAAYAELDGRDIEDGALHVWAETEGGEVVGALRLLDEGSQWRIGRVVAAPAVRGSGIAGTLMTRALEVAAAADPGRDVVLDAQEHLAAWYARFGFAAAGPGFVEDAIPHVPMRRSSEISARRP